MEIILVTKEEPNRIIPIIDRPTILVITAGIAKTALHLDFQ